MATKTQRKLRQLTDLVPRLRRTAGFEEIVTALRRGESATIDGAWGSASALSAATLATEVPGTLLIVLPRLRELDEFAADLASFLGEAPAIFPAWEMLPQEENVSDPVFGSRLRVLRALESASPPRVVVTAIQALLQPVPSRADRERGTRTLRIGESINLDELLRWLVANGFTRVTALEVPGEFSVHGGIVDIFPPDALDPLRLELFGDEIESIRVFDVETQRKLEDLRDVGITIVLPSVPVLEGERGRGGDKERGSEGDGAEEARDGNLESQRLTSYSPSPPLPLSPTSSLPLSPACSALDSLPSASWVALVEMQELLDEAKHYLDRLNDCRGLFSVQGVLQRCTRLPTVTIAPLAAGSLETTCHLQVESIERFTGPRAEALRELATVVGNDEQVLIACHNEGAKERLAELLAESETLLSNRVELCLGSVARGFRLVPERLIVLSDNELFHRTEVLRAPRRRRIESRAIDSFLELSEGDLVVHLTHGIARYLGMELLEKADQKEEHLKLEFKEGVIVYVPVSLIHLVQKYVGGAKASPELSKLGTSGWARKKQRVAESVTDLASDMLRLQAEREAKPGIEFPPDSHWQQEFEAAFPYTETDDQLKAITDFKHDMELPRPMDRLICGDVGYGKTEVAMRAAFKAVDAGQQVAILVPTTVLAEQHFRSFTSRMAEFPVTMEVLSRFKTKSEQRRILDGLANGSLDIVIGTHRLVQPDVRFKDLGLLIIDEEQRFGVEAKEMLKKLRLEVDVLTLSATPIPRTLHMSLLGIRDISNLETPPQDRLAVETRISRFDRELIRQAIVRELNRNGQIYFVHNRVYNIHSIADQIRSIVPEATVDVVHGQMAEDELEPAMLGFVSGRTDVLVATTIIESGLDIPNANTIFIHQADQYGLADLHQLRGRVGRHKHRAYCYLLLEDGKSLTPNAAKRLKAIEEFSELGAGFKIAMRDLEIRGAGNILGTEQSGNIAAVGYELYCQLLENAVHTLKKQPIREHRHVAVDLPFSAYLPGAYVPPGRPKIEMYRKLSSVQSLEQLHELADELRDRFGPVPDEAQTLLQIRELQILAQQWQIDGIHLEEGYAVFGYRHPRKIKQLSRLSPQPLRIVDARSAYLVLPYRFEMAGLLDLLKSVLQPK